MIESIVRVNTILNYETDFATKLCKITTVIQHRHVVICHVDSIIFWNAWDADADEQIDLLTNTLLDCVVNFV